MSFVTTAKAMTWVAEELGRSLPSQSKEVLSRLNDVRRLFYSAYQKIRLNFYSDLCFKLEELPEECPTCGDSPSTYLGFALPHELEQVEQAWLSGIPMNIHNSWYEYQTHTQGYTEKAKLIDMGIDYPLAKDWCPGTCETLRFIAESPEDCGKKIRVSFINSTDSLETREITLNLDGVCVTEVKSLTRPGGIVILDDLCGGLTVTGKSGVLYGYIHPGTSIPAFRRLKATNGCLGNIVHIKATRKFQEVCFGWEVIETDNKLAILEALRYLKVLETNSSDAQWIAKAKMHMQNCIELIAGANYRSDGGSSVRFLNLRPVKVTRTGLRRNRR